MQFSNTIKELRSVSRSYEIMSYLWIALLVVLLIIQINGCAKGNTTSKKSNSYDYEESYNR